ncbi:hypothetical protein ZTR_07752 [Talaromyces verruculosus]|nr:hypothetical protein ZTR_07752 [Talaromyces verruculosus]
MQDCLAYSEIWFHGPIPCFLECIDEINQYFADSDDDEYDADSYYDMEEAIIVKMRAADATIGEALQRTEPGPKMGIGSEGSDTALGPAMGAMKFSGNTNLFRAILEELTQYANSTEYSRDNEYEGRGYPASPFPSLSLPPF